jgi:hypothetical protein
VADELHLELDALRDAFWDRSELSRPLVFVSYGEPPDHVRALMRTLGVRVEVRPVTATSSKRGTDVAVSAASFAAQDYRASIASVHRREQAGDQAVTCGSCGTETDVTKVAHSPSCSSYAAPEPAAKAKANAGGDGPGRPAWEKSRSGGRRSTRERNKAGELSSGEMQRRHEAVLDQAATVTSCAFAGCGWRFEGGALEGREASAAHRAAEHPDAGKGKRSRFPKPGQSNSQAGLEQGLDALAAMDAGRPQPVRPVEEPQPPEPPIEAGDNGGGTVEEPAAVATATDVDGAKKNTPRGYWTRDLIVAAIKTYAAEQGRPPSADDWRHADPERRRPTTDAVMKAFGKWTAGIRAAGFEPRQRGRGPAPAAAAPDPEDSSSERAASESPARGHARPVVDRGLDDQPPPMGARTAAATDRTGEPEPGPAPDAAEGPPSLREALAGLIGATIVVLEAAQRELLVEASAPGERPVRVAVRRVA